MVERKSQSESSADLLQGTLELLILKTLQLQPLHGWGISERIRQTSGGVFEVIPGSLYPALERLKRGGWIESEWKTTENNRRARYYKLTPSGIQRLTKQEEEWLRSSRAVNRILRTVDQET